MRQVTNLHNSDMKIAVELMYGFDFGSVKCFEYRRTSTHAVVCMTSTNSDAYFRKLPLFGFAFSDILFNFILSGIFHF